MISNKETLISILKQLVWHWWLAEGFLWLVKKSDDEKLLEKTYTLIKKQISNIKEEKQRDSVSQQLRMIAKHREIELREYEESDKILDSLLQNDTNERNNS